MEHILSCNLCGKTEHCTEGVIWYSSYSAVTSRPSRPTGTSTSTLLQLGVSLIVLDKMNCVNQLEKNIKPYQNEDAQAPTCEAK